MTPADKATEILEQLELKSQNPLPLQKIVEHLGYEVQLFKPNEKTRNLSGGVDQNKKVLMANSSDTPQEQRYSFAHSIAHIVLHPGENIIDRKNNLHYTNEEPKEQEANQFADELLMETTLFLNKWEETQGDTIKLGSMFGVSKERIIARASLLGID